jgi:hypothetical protein
MLDNKSGKILQVDYHKLFSQYETKVQIILGLNIE